MISSKWEGPLDIGGNRNKNKKMIRKSLVLFMKIRKAGKDQP